MSQSKPHGPATLILHSLGDKPMSAMSAVRQLAGLNLPEITVLAGMLPGPLLHNVSLEFALQAREQLELMGIEVELSGVPPREADIALPAEIQESRPAHSAGVALPSGPYVVLLTHMGLLETRVIEGICKLTGASQEDAVLMTRQLPQRILVGVDEETAHRMQRELQMVAAVVDIELVSEIESEADALDEAAPESAHSAHEVDSGPSPQLLSLWLVEAGPYRTPLIYKLNELTGMTTAQIERLLEKLPALILSETDKAEVEGFQQSLNSVGAVTELVLDP